MGLPSRTVLLQILRRFSCPFLFLLEILGPLTEIIVLPVPINGSLFLLDQSLFPLERQRTDHLRPVPRSVPSFFVEEDSQSCVPRMAVRG